MFALFGMSTAFVVLGFALKENLTLDYGIKNFSAWLTVVIFPFLLVISGYFGFVKLIELTGAVAIGIMLLMIIIMHSKAKKIGNRTPESEMNDSLIIKLIVAMIISIGILYGIFGGL